MWFPEYSDILGNEMAHELANSGSSETHDFNDIIYGYYERVGEYH